jgi:hypothetical protein
VPVTISGTPLKVKGVQELYSAAALTPVDAQTGLPVSLLRATMQLLPPGLTITLAPLMSGLSA